jgi:hypothetical protein
MGWKGGMGGMARIAGQGCLSFFLSVLLLFLSFCLSFWLGLYVSQVGVFLSLVLSLLIHLFLAGSSGVRLVGWILSFFLSGPPKHYFIQCQISFC